MTAPKSYHRTDGPATPAQQRFLEAVRVLTLRDQRAPTYWAIARLLGFRTVSTVFEHVRVLQGKGLIAPAKRYAHGVRLTGRCLLCGHQ